MNLRVNLFVCIIITFFSCKNNTNDYNSKNSMYIDKIEQNYKEFKEDDWKIVEEKYKEYIMYYEKTKETRWVTTDEDGTEKAWYFENKPTARTMVVKHLCCEIKPTELFTPRVITEELLRNLDETVIKKTFMLPNIGTLDDLSEIADELELIDTDIEDND